MQSTWQIFVAVFSDHGGMILATELSEPSGWWMDVPTHVAAEAAVDGAWVRLA